jgi:hypothetical protein
MIKQNISKSLLPVFIPENLNAELILDDNGIVRIDTRRNLKAAMFYILDIIYKMSQNRNWREYYDEYGGYPLQSKLLNKVIGKKYGTVLELLEKSGVIKRTSSYKVGIQSKLVTLTAKYSAEVVKVLSIPKEASLFKRLLIQREKHRLQNEAALDKISYITKWFDNKRLMIDPEKAHGLIEFYGVEMKTLIPDTLPKDRTEEEVESHIEYLSKLEEKSEC